MAAKSIISDSELPAIRQRLTSGETFTSVAATYGVKAWTIQKRLRIYHPTGGRNVSDTWNYVSDYMGLARCVWRRYKRFIADNCLFDIVVDKLFSFTVNELRKIRMSDKPFWMAHDLLCAKVRMYYEGKKKQPLHAAVMCFDHNGINP